VNGPHEEKQVRHFNTRRRVLTAGLCGAVAAALTPLARAQGGWKPERAVELISGTAAGSAPDRMARVLQDILRDKSKLPVPTAVVNRPGAGGAVAWNYLNQHPADAHYLMIAAGNLSIGYLTGASALSDKDFTPVCLLAHEYIALSVRADSPIRDGRDLVERLRKDPGALVLGVSSVAGSTTHIGGVLVLKAAGVDVRKVRTVVFDSSGKSMTAMVGGHVDFMSGSTSISMTGVRNGQTRILGYGAPRRLAGELAQVPTWREQGIDVHFSNYRGIIGAKGWTPAQVSYWGAVFAEIARDERWRADLEKNHLSPDFMPGRETRKFWDDLSTPIRSTLEDLQLIK
jgi:putative tricarboxylic transport membrane protein